jgi:predicted nucleic acid-binding protein
MSDPVPRVLLDTSVIVEAGYGRSGPFEHLLRDAADQRVQVIVPEVVLAETGFVYRRELQHMRGALEDLPRLLAAAGHRREQLRPRALKESMERELRKRLAEAGIAPVPAPASDHDELARRIMARRKPTKALAHDRDGNELSEQNEGYRDQIIWEHVRAAAQDGPLVFACANTRDFADRKTVSEGRAELHPDLQEELKADRDSGRSTGEVTLVLSVQAFVRDHLQDEDILNDMRRLLDGRAGGELGEIVRQEVRDSGVQLEGYEPPVALQSHVEEATLATLDSVDDIEVIDVYLESDEGEPREYGVTLDVTGSGGVDWAVNAPSSWDLEKFSGLVEGDTAGGGIILDSDPSQVQITLSGRYLPSEEEWSEIEVESARQTPQEVQEREARNYAAQLHAEQELGLFPSDEEIEAMEAPQMPRRKAKARDFQRGAWGG